MPRKYVRVDDTATLLHHRGTTTLPEAPPETDRGEVVLCLHDAGGNGAAFDPVLDDLADGHSPIAFDLPGHARSGGLDSLGAVDRMADFALGLADALGLRPAVWLGEGMGSAVALEAARRGPERVRALVLCGVAAPAAVSEASIAALGRVVGGRARREFDAEGYGPDTPRAVYGRAFGEWVKTDPRATLGDLGAMHAWHAAEPAAGRARGVAAPALVVVGSAEGEADRAAAEALAAAFPDGRTRRLDGSGRHPTFEQPAALAEAVSSFVAEVAP